MKPEPGSVGDELAAEGFANPEPPLMDRAGAARGMAWTSLGAMVTRMIFPLASIYLARALGPAVNGNVALLAQIIVISDILRDGGLTQNYFIEKSPSRKTESVYFTASLITGGIPALLVLLATPWAVDFFKADYLWAGFPIVAATIMVQTFGTMAMARLSRLQKFREIALLNMISGGGTLALTIILVKLGWGIKAILLQMILGAVIGVFAMNRLSPSPRPSTDWPTVWERIRSSMVLVTTNLINNLFLTSDVVVLQKWLGPTFTGYYNYAMNLASKPADGLYQPLVRTLIIGFSQFADDFDRLRNTYFRSLAAVVMFVMPIYILFAVYAEPIVLILGGEAFQGSIPIMRIICVFLLFRSVGSISGNVLIPLKLHRYTLYPWFAAIAVTASALFFIDRNTGLSMANAWATQLALPSTLGISLEAIDSMRHQGILLIAGSYMLGAMTVYVSVLVIAVRALRARSEDWQRVGVAAFCTLLTAIFLMTIRAVVPGAPWIGLLVALMSAPLFHLATLGTLLKRGAFAFLSPRGVKTLWHTL